VIEYRRKLEKDLLAKADATLEPLLGPGRYRIGLSVDCDFSSGEQSEELYDPDKSVMLTSQKTEENGGSASSAGVPGTASNLPRPAPRQNGAGVSTTKRTENISFQSSRTVRKMRLPQGSVRRISASVLLDQAVQWQTQNGQPQRVLVPPSAENIRVIRELVAGAIGLVPTRGDQLVVESLPFDSTLRTAPPPTTPKGDPRAPLAQPGPGTFVLMNDWRLIAGGAAAALLLAVAALFFWRRKRRKKIKATTQAALSATNRDIQPLPGAAAAGALSGNEAASRMIAEAQEKAETGPSIETIVDKLRQTVADDPALAASVLRTWLEDTE
jgi:flagellar M-ring protein FliF